VRGAECPIGFSYGSCAKKLYKHLKKAVLPSEGPLFCVLFSGSRGRNRGRDSRDRRTGGRGRAHARGGHSERRDRSPACLPGRPEPRRRHHLHHHRPHGHGFHELYGIQAITV